MDSATHTSQILRSASLTSKLVSAAPRRRMEGVGEDVRLVSVSSP